MKNNIICPVSKDKIPEAIPRIIAFLNIGLILVYFITKLVWIEVFLLTDFYIRAFHKIKYSPLSLLSQLIYRILRLSSKHIDKAPKIFAARLGFSMLAVSLILTVSGVTLPVFVILGLLSLLSTIECVFNFCVGCYIYNYFVFPFYNKDKGNKTVGF